MSEHTRHKAFYLNLNECLIQTETHVCRTQFDLRPKIHRPRCHDELEFIYHFHYINSIKKFSNDKALKAIKFLFRLLARTKDRRERHFLQSQQQKRFFPKNKDNNGRNRGELGIL